MGGLCHHATTCLFASSKDFWKQKSLKELGLDYEEDVEVYPIEIHATELLKNVQRHCHEETKFDCAVSRGVFWGGKSSTPSKRPHNNLR
nr:hypothetical protein HmN_000610000 [Hymenolepis microstoma]